MVNFNSASDIYCKKGKIMIKIKKCSRLPDAQQQPYKPDGDILFGEDYIAGEVKKEEIKSIIMLSAMRTDTWKALSAFGIDYEKFKEEITYQCPYREIPYYWFFPTFIICNDINVYKDLPEVNMSRFSFASDVDFWVNMHKCYEEKSNQVEQSFLGHGFTNCTLPSDGSGEIEHVYVNLSNGDKLAGYVWVWYNK